MTVNELKTAIKVLSHVDSLNEDTEIDYSINIIIDLLRNILLQSNTKEMK